MRENLDKGLKLAEVNSLKNLPSQTQVDQMSLLCSPLLLCSMMYRNYLFIVEINKLACTVYPTTLS